MNIEFKDFILDGFNLKDFLLEAGDGQVSDLKNNDPYVKTYHYCKL